MLEKLLSLPLFFLLVAMAPAAERPNIVLVMADDQGWGDMAYNGHPVLKTPNFDAAAATGLRFDRFYAAAPSVRRRVRAYSPGGTPIAWACSNGAIQCGRRKSLWPRH